MSGGDRPTWALLTVVLPAWNEEDGVLVALDAVAASADELVAARQVGAVEVVVVDDGSTDGTAALLAARAAEDGRLRVVTHPGNRGLGAAVRSGLAASTGDVVLYTDADLPFDLGEVPRALRLMHERDAGLVALYRNDRAGEGVRRWVYSYAYNLLVRAVLGLRVRDVNFAGKFIRRDVVDAVELRSDGSFVDAELLARAVRTGCRVVQFGVEYFPRSRGVSTLSSGRVIRTMLREMRAQLPGLRSTSGPTD